MIPGIRPQLEHFAELRDTLHITVEQSNRLAVLATQSAMAEIDRDRAIT
jgi:hypothetical protein